MRGILDTIIQNIFSEIMTLYEGWPLARVALYRGTTVHVLPILIEYHVIPYG